MTSSALPPGTVMFLFTDIEGSTRRWERAPAAMQAALARHDALLHQAIESHHGHVFKTVGDAFCAVFADPAAALAAAQAAQRALAAEAWGEIGPLWVRMALHTGEAEERDADYFGPAVNRVARILSTGHGQQILLSRAAANLVRESLPANTALRDLGSHRLKDLARPEHIFQLVAPDLPADFAPLKSLDARPNNLPNQLTPLIGREREVASARAFLAEDGTRLVTLTGPGGTGKTRLGLAVAAELTEAFADGVWFVNLSAVREASLVVPEIARTLGVRDEGHQPLLARLTEVLQDEQTLLLLDNLEQVISAASDVAALLAACSGVRILATSRIPLRVRGECIVAVAPLAVPDGQHPQPLATLAAVPAVHLFVERAQAAKPDFALDAANAPTVATICRRLEGLPLAIELAAARVRLLPPAVLLGRLEQRLSLLTGGARDLPVRQQTMRAAIAWSYDLLEPAAQACFRSLAVFAGGCTLDAAEAIWASQTPLAASVDLLDAMGTLVESSLVRVDTPDGGEPRFVILETIREYGLERLEDTGETAAACQAHAAYYITLAEAAEPELSGAHQAAWLDRLDAEYGNLRAMMGWLVERADVTTAAQIGQALWLFWARRGHLGEGREWLERVREQSAAAPPDVRAQTLHHLANIACDLADYQQARELYTTSLALRRTVGDRAGAARSLIGLGRVAYNHGDYACARTHYIESRALLEALGDRRGVAFALDNLGEVAAAEGDYEAGRHLHEKALALLQAVGDEGSIAYSYHKIGKVAFGEGNLAAAQRAFEEARQRADAIGDKLARAFALHGLGTVALRHEEDEVAAEHFGTALALCHEMSDKQGSIECLEGLALVAAAHGRPEQAARLFAATAAHREALGASLPPHDCQRLARAVAAVRESLGEAAFAAIWTTGQGLSLSDAAVEVLHLLTRVESVST